jgi:FdhD protein
MMATPADLEDFAIGFSITEALISAPSDVRALEIVAASEGVEARMWLSGAKSLALMKRRRSLVGPTGCGLCGLESLAQAAPVLPAVPGGGEIAPGDILRAVRAMAAAQPLGAMTRTAHAAGFWSPDRQEMLVREDVGRHNALDKLVGALTRNGVDAAAGAVVLTSRVSVEMVQKTARLGAPILVAISAPTALAVRTAEACGMTLIGVARSDGFEVFTGRQRVLA